MDIRYFGQNARLSEAVVAGGFVFLSGMVPENTEADVKGQTQDVLAQIDRWLEKCGSDKAHILEATVFLADMDGYAAMNERTYIAGALTTGYGEAIVKAAIHADAGEVEGKKLLDGGIADSIPLRFFQQQGYTRNLVVLTQPEGFVKEPNPLMPLMRIWLHRHPHIVRALEQRHVMYNEELEYVRAEEKKPGTLVLRPKGKLTIGHISHDPSEMQATYDQGREVALENLKKISEVEYDRNRLEQELIYYLEKLDINEEKDRLAYHLTYFLRTLDSEHGQGKKLGFIAQEIGREINTLGSKSNHAEMQIIVVRMKDVLEQIKEQILNVL